MKYSKEALRRRIYNPDDTYESWGNIFESHILSSGTILSNLNGKSLLMKKTISGPRMDIEIFSIVPRRKQGQRTDNGTTPIQRDRNYKHSTKRLIHLAFANFNLMQDYIIVLTFGRDYNEEVYDIKYIQKLLDNFFDRIRRVRKKAVKEGKLKKKDQKLKYIYTICTDENKRPHIHMIMNGGIVKETITKAWNEGATYIKLLESEQDIEKSARYLYKQNIEAKKRGELKNVRMWVPSRGLKQPEETWRCVNPRMVNIIKNERCMKENLEKYFPSYAYRGGGFDGDKTYNSIYWNAVLLKKSKDQIQPQNVAFAGRNQKRKKQNSSEIRKNVKVNKEGFIRFRNVNYSVPIRYKNQYLTVAADEKEVRIFDKNGLIRIWERGSASDRWRIKKDDNPNGWDCSDILAWARKIGLQTETYIRVYLSKEKYPIKAFGACRGILSLAKKCGKEALELCCYNGRLKGNYSYRYIKEHIWENGDKIEAQEKRMNSNMEQKSEQMNFFNIIDRG